MDFTEEELKQIDKLPLIPKMCLNSLLKCITKILNGECNDRELTQTLQHIDADNKGYIDPSEYYSADKARRYLRCDNNKFYKLVHKHNVNIYKIKDKNLGYKRSDLDYIVHKEAELNNNTEFFVKSIDRRKEESRIRRETQSILASIKKGEIK